MIKITLFNKSGNKTIALISVFVLVLYGFLVLGALNVIPVGLALTTALGTAVFTGVGAIVLLLETWFEGKRPNILKDTGATINTVFGVLMLVFAVILAIGQPAITGIWNGVLAVGYSITWILLARELLFD